MADQASALGHSDRAPDAALVKLTEREGQGTEAEIEMLVDDAAECEWALFIQRRLAGCPMAGMSSNNITYPVKFLRLGAAPRFGEGPLKLR